MSDELKQELADAKSCVRWISLAMIFIVLAVIAEAVGFVGLFINFAFGMKALLFSAMLAGVSFYCKWCSDSIKPESWS